MTFEKNICSCERIVRIVVGLGLASLAFWGPKNLWFLLGLIPVLVGIVGFCPVYALLKKNRVASCKSSCCCKKKD